MTFSRELFHQAARLFSPQIEVLSVPFGQACLPGYFLSGGSGKRPTLLVINGGDSTSEELVHWIGFAAVEQGWNCCIFEGPGQWSALQLNPGLYLRHDYEVPVKAVVDYLVGRDDVDTDSIALLGYSLSTQLAARAAAFEKRICACICFGGIVVDVNEAWEAVMPAALRNALPGLFNVVFHLLEKISPELRAFVNHFSWTMGVNSPYALLQAWEAFNIKGLAPRIECPVLILMGEGEYAQTDTRTVLGMMGFMRELPRPVTVHEFKFGDGWAASHCSVGDEAPGQKVIFDWLDRVVIRKEQPLKIGTEHNWKLVNQYFHTEDVLKLQQGLHLRAI